jgi:hypothetical protein
MPPRFRIRSLMQIVATIALLLGLDGAVRRQHERLRYEELDRRLRDLDRQLAVARASVGVEPIRALTYSEYRQLEFGGLEDFEGGKSETDSRPLEAASTLAIAPNQIATASAPGSTCPNTRSPR